MISLAQFQERIGYSFRDEGMLALALTHPSSYRHLSNQFERLEFLGDRVLGLVIAHWLLQEYPREKEGDLAKRQAVLVSRKICDIVASKIALQEVSRFSLNDVVQGSSVPSDTVEALIAAIYLDGGLEAAQGFIKTFWKEWVHQDLRPPKDPKTALQEWVQAQNQDLPHYQEVERTGPAHAPLFIVEVKLFNGMAGRGEGTSKRLAERAAAEVLLNKIKLKK